MKKVLLPVLTITFSLVAAYFILSVWRGVSLYSTDPSRQDLEKAIRLTPSNPDPYYRLALLYEWGVQKADLQQSLQYLKKAIERNPLEQQYWLSLAKLHFRMGEIESSQKALERAIQVFPTGYQGRWMSGNLLLQQGKTEEAIAHFSYLLTHYPNQSYLIYEVLRRAINDSDFIFERVIPKDPFSTHQYLTYLYEIRDHESARRVWQKRLLLGHPAGRNETLQHIEFLLQEAEIHEAFNLWKARLREEGLPFPQGGELITNGGFEEEGLLGRGFDWKISPVGGAKAWFDPSNAFQGKRSLKIEFDGKENVDFHHVTQYVALKPETDYLLTAQVKTRGVTTKSGLKIEVVGRGASFHRASEPLIGDNDWRKIEVAFRTPAKIRGGLIRLRREKTDKFDRFISGTVWIDQVTLREKARGD